MDKIMEEGIKALVARFGENRRAELIADLIQTSLKLGEDNAKVADLKLFSRALREMRYAAKVFAPFSDRKKVAVFGSARTSPEAEEFKIAREFGRKIVEKGFMVITGGGDGIMGAAQEGAGAENSFGLNIQLPFEQRANEIIQGDPKLVNFRYFFTRKLNFLKETHAVVLFPGGFGTHDEGFESLTLMQTGKAQIMPLVMLDKPGGYYWETFRRFLANDLLENGLISQTDFHLFTVAHDVDRAVEEIVKFYSNFDSYRWVREKMVIRIKHKLSNAAIINLNKKFEELLIAGVIEQTGPLPEERDEEHLKDMSRIVLVPHKRDFGMLRVLINAINESERA